jgi:hypothetical protein
MSFLRNFISKKSVIKIRRTLLFLLLGAFLSCVSMPPVQNNLGQPEESIEGESDTGAADGIAGSTTGGAADNSANIAGGPPENSEHGDSPANEDVTSVDEEIPDVHLPPREEGPDEAAGGLDEPFADLPETTEAPLPPEEAAGAGLQEPAAPALGEVPETFQDIEEAPSGSAIPPAGEVPPPAPSPQEPPSESEKEPPPPPPFLGPVEEEVPPRKREPVPLPPNPVPDLPARTPAPAVPEEFVFSRVVRAAVGRLVEIPFRGAGWVYLGELSSRQGLAYDSRRLDPEGQSFMFRCEKPGTYVLKFYKQDFIRDYILNDHVQVIVGEAPENAGIGLFNPPIDRGRVIAEPRWPPLDREEPSQESPPRTGQMGVEEASVVRTPPPGTAASDGGGGDSSSEGDSLSQGTAGGLVPGAVSGNGGDEGTAAAGIPEDSLPGDYVRMALEEYNAGRIAQALTVMDRLRQRFPAGTDEAWWLLGQLLEANSPARDIRLALEYYRRLVREFPQSRRVPSAQQRIAYLERFYFNIQ